MLKEASRQWFAINYLDESLLQGFTQCKNDYSLFIKRVGSQVTIATIYVDDIILTGNDLSSITALKFHLHVVFSIKDMSKLHYSLGIEVTYMP